MQLRGYAWRRSRHHTLGNRH